MFGYARDETPELTPAPIYYAHRLVERQAELVQGRHPPFLRRMPRARSPCAMWMASPQHRHPWCFHQHTPDQSETGDEGQVQAIVIEEIIKPVIPARMAAGHQVPDQPHRPVCRRSGGDCGPDDPQDHCGHPTAVHAPHGGGAFSGKDPARWWTAFRCLCSLLRGQEHRGYGLVRQCRSRWRMRLAWHAR